MFPAYEEHSEAEESHVEMRHNNIDDELQRRMSSLAQFTEIIWVMSSYASGYLITSYATPTSHKPPANASWKKANRF